MWARPPGLLLLAAAAHSRPPCLISLSLKFRCKFYSVSGNTSDKSKEETQINLWQYDFKQSNK